MISMPTGVRDARAQDAPVIARVTLDCWRDAGVPAELLGDATVLDVTSAWAAAITAPPSPRHLVLIATDARGDVCGYAALGPSDDPDADASETCLHSLEVDPQARRLGHGSRLLAAAADMCATEVLTAWCGVDDAGRRTFLESAGWAADGSWRDLQAPDGRTRREIRLSTAVR